MLFTCYSSLTLYNLFKYRQSRYGAAFSDKPLVLKVRVCCEQVLQVVLNESCKLDTRWICMAAITSDLSTHAPIADVAADRRIDHSEHDRRSDVCLSVLQRDQC